MIDETKHTPAPWYIDETFGLIMWQDKEVAAIHAGRNGDAAANAQLIAAAPELLEALYVAEAELEQSIAAGSEIVLRCVRDAIAKATGGAK